MSKTIRAFCLSAAREHDLSVEQEIYDMWAQHGSPLYQPKPLGHGGQLECTEHKSWAFLPGAIPSVVVEPPHIRKSGDGAWADGVYVDP